MEGAPEDEGPVGTVPQTAEQEDDHDVERPTANAHTTAAKGDIEIVAEPAGERDVPAVPELADATAEVGGAEVVHEVVAHGLGAAEGDGAVAEEVAIDLERVEEQTQRNGSTAVLLRVGPDGIDIDGEVVGHHHLGKEAEEDEHDALREVVAPERLVDTQLSEQVLRALDRACHQLGVEHDVEGVDAQMLFWLLVAAIDLYHIAEALEGVERQADGEDDMCLMEESLVLEDEEDGESGDDACHQPRLTFTWIVAATLNHQCCGVVDEDGGQQYKDVYGLEPHIEEAAGSQQPAPTPSVGQEVVDQRDHWEEYEEWE